MEVSLYVVDDWRDDATHNEKVRYKYSIVSKCYEVCNNWQACWLKTKHHFWIITTWLSSYLLYMSALGRFLIIFS